MKFEEYTYQIAGHFLPALVNGDRTGLSDQEDEQLDKFLADLTEELQCFPGAMIFEPADESNFAYDDVTGLLAECYETVVYIPVNNLYRK